MMSAQTNEKLTRVGPGTPGGEMLRRYWHPIAVTETLDAEPVQTVRLLAEDFVLYRDRSGTLGLLEPRCPHRRVHLSTAIPEPRGLRCCYHGWLFDADGRCLEQPLEPPDSLFRDRVRIRAYQVQEMGGLIWAYIGPSPVPLLPRWDLFVRETGFRQIVGHQLPCNWLQVAENRADLAHSTYLHGRLFQYVLEREGRLTDDPNARYNGDMARQATLHANGQYVRYRALFNEFGLTKASVLSDGDETVDTWQIGNNPILFPYLLAFGPYRPGHIRRTYQIGVPIDDEHTWHLQYFCYTFPDEIEVPAQDGVPYTEAPLRDGNGKHVLDYVLAQDMVAWYAQGTITDRTQEKLALSDKIIIAYRRLIEEQIDQVAAGGEPLNQFWDEASADRPELRIPGFDRAGSDTSQVGYKQEQGVGDYRRMYHLPSKGGWLYLDDDADRMVRDRETVIRLYRETAELRSGERATT
jgi:5,5'-dehydrodivanillate O-demethylase oxygenase subunit